MDTWKMLTHGKENRVETDHFLVWTSPQKIHTNPIFLRKEEMLSAQTMVKATPKL